MTDGDEIRRKRRELRELYGVVYEQLNGILFAEDPMDINFEDNTDEYEPEVGTILPRLHECQSADDVRLVVHEEFVTWFGVSIAGPQERYQTIAVRVWDEIVPLLRS